MLEETLRGGFDALGLPLGETALRRYRLYAERLVETNKVMNLTAITEEDEITRLHFLDSAALLTLADFSGRRVIDVFGGAQCRSVIVVLLSLPSAQRSLTA